MEELSLMNNKISCGYDNIPMKVIKTSIETISQPLAFIINKAFMNGVFPDRLKMAVVKPLYKRDNPEDFGNYRPISLLTSFSKIFEKILANRLMKFFKKHKISSRCQHGFVGGRNTDTAIFELVHTIMEVLEVGDIPLNVFLDFSKAFDCVQHDLLLEKLEACGIRDNQLLLMSSYLQNRKQKLVISKNEQEFASSERELIMGVPQGSILGPLLFVIYINDLPGTLKGIHSSLMFADDTNFIVSGNSVDSVLSGASDAIERILEWCKNNKILLNLDKTECVMFHTDQTRMSRPNTSIVKNMNTSIEESSKFLGLYIDANMKWSKHIDSLSKRLHSVIYTLNALKHHVEGETLRIVYFSNFQSLMSYGITFWGHSSHAHKIFLDQKWALRINSLP